VEIVDHFAAVGGRVFLLLLDDLLHDDIEAAMAFDGGPVTLLFPPCGTAPQHVLFAFLRRSIRKPPSHIGSSPRLRGTVANIQEEGKGERFIPAPAGNSAPDLHL